MFLFTLFGDRRVLILIFINLLIKLLQLQFEGWLHVATMNIIHTRRRLYSRRRMLRFSRQRASPVIWTHPRTTHWWDVIVPTFNRRQFVKNFRVSPETFDYMCRRLGPTIGRRDTNYRLCIPVHKRVGMALWKLATNNEYRTISHLFGVGVSTVLNSVRDFCEAVIQVLLPLHLPVPDGDKFIEMAAFFKERWGVPQCVGAIDGSHIPIIAPEDYASDYFNRKGWHSIVLQGVVNGKGQFWDVCVGFPGSVHDARVLKQSELWKRLGDGQILNMQKQNIAGHEIGHFLIGDPAYPLQTWLMKPFSDTGRLTQEQQRFNYKISSARSVVETAFGRLKGRWRCLMKRNDCKLEMVKKMVLTCCVLHNMCEDNGDRCPEDIVDTLTHMQPPLTALPERGQQEGADVRAALMRHFNANE
ncbi:hypothetical protein ACEWY4_016051 [Coilia grayii]|uniref:DDE Tnp4 domain-containing protein n=1 Tax=Coilia grayii TaxID=363190 RepID=A0ABD1JQK8_9TELE